MSTGDNLRPRPVSTVLDVLRVRIDPDTFDVVVLWLEAVATDLGYGDVRGRPGAVAWIDALRADGKRTALVYAGNGIESAVASAGLQERFDLVVSGSRSQRTYAAIAEELGVDADRMVAVDVDPGGLGAAHAAGLPLAIGVAHDGITAERLRAGGADTVVADLQELLRAMG
jgi:beta-phosphoglucomutase-like phosphatase (HAD superfamily)